MTDAVDPILVAEVERDEGLVLKAYPDPLSPLAKWLAAGHGRRETDLAARGLSGAPWTIGYGHTGPEVHQGLVWSQAQAAEQLAIDLALHNALLARVLPWSATLSPPRRRVLQNMVFNMGWDNPKTPRLEGLSGFVHTLEAIRTGQWQVAHDGMLASGWAREVGARAVRLANQMLTGVEAA